MKVTAKYSLPNPPKRVALRMAGALRSADWSSVAGLVDPNIKRSYAELAHYYGTLVDFVAEYEFGLAPADVPADRG
ncbi:hypothetical protein ACIBG0_20985 [Nocardia sp. NPDC050630]|uniref:hypothetical protein n=1 Tax=Nocardia sp. NPDC050630 TaxID=3364321 RepID=UPI003790BD5D